MPSDVEHANVPSNPRPSPSVSSPVTDPGLHGPDSGAWSNRVILLVGVAALCWFSGAFLLWPSAARLADFWRVDDLKSVGALVPFLSFALILRAWRAIGWETRGTWWGLALLAVWAVLIFVRERTLFVVTVNGSWLVQLPPLPLVAVVFALGYVLLLGGRELLRVCWFPVLLMWAVIPVPQTFSNRVDLPLQHLSALVARAFAHLLGAQLTSDKLRVMFTPDIGMFIAPGCNGIRGAIVLGMAALVIGYLYRFRWYVHVATIVGAVLLAYLFNLLRLCLLDVYYRVTLHYPWWEDRGTGADYIIGGTLFLVALLLFFTAVNRLREKPDETTPPPAMLPEETTPLTALYWRAAGLLVVSALFGGEYMHLRAAQLNNTRPIPALPAQIGDWRLVDRYDDTLMDGVVVYAWGEYVSQDGTLPHVKLGLAPEMDQHDAEACHMSRGENPVWQGQIDAPTVGGSAQFAAFTYISGPMQWLEASTVCDGAACDQFHHASDHVTVVYGRPHLGLGTTLAQQRPVPVLLRVESGDVTTAPKVMAQQLSSTLKLFLAQANLAQIAAPYERR